MRPIAPFGRVLMMFAVVLSARCNESRPDAASPSCTYAVSFPASQFGPAGGTSSASIITAGGCAWSATSDAGWITVQGSNSGSGNGTVAVVIAPYEGAETRTGTLTVARQVFSLTQTACDFRISPDVLTVGDQGGSSAADIVVQAGCRWAVENVPPWISVEPLGGVGSATVRVSISENNEDSRQATLRMASALLVVRQSKEPCPVSLSPSTRMYGAGGGIGTLEIKIDTGCAWKVQSDVPWLRLDSTAGTAATTVRFTVDPNEHADDRQARLLVNGVGAEISQSGQNGCQVSVNPVRQFARLAAGTGEFRVDAAPGCRWTLASSESWLHLRGSSSGAGAARISFGYDRHPSGHGEDFRRAAIQVRWPGPTAGENMWVWQFPECHTRLLDPDSQRSVTEVSFGADGGRKLLWVLVDHPFACPWTALLFAEDWVTLRGPIEPRYQRGDGDIAITVSPNPSSASRRVVLTVGERLLTIIQSGR